MKLGDLKVHLAEKFGVRPGSQLRLFYMGRELKSGGRSLLKLGLGKFRNGVLHMHDVQLANHGQGVKRSRRNIASSDDIRFRGRSTDPSNSGVIEIIDDSDDEAPSADFFPRASNQRRRLA